jgi:hypothetical protein
VNLSGDFFGKLEKVASSPRLNTGIGSNGLQPFYENSLIFWAHWVYCPLNVSGLFSLSPPTNTV